MGKELYALDTRSETGEVEILLRKLRTNFVTTSADCSDVLQIDCKECQKFLLKINVKRRRESNN